MTKDEALKLSMEAMEITGGFDVEINAIKEALAQPEPWEKFCDSNCVWTDHHPDCKLAQPEYQSTADKSKLEKVPAKGTLLAQPEQKPVAWRYKILDYFGRPVWTLKTPRTDIRVLESQPLYTTPPQRKPLTDEEIANTLTGYRLSDAIDITRAIEAAHGIKGEK